MITDRHASVIAEMIGLMCTRLSQASAQTKAALTLTNDAHHDKAFDILLDAEQPILEANTLLKTIALLRREEGS